jgi:pimeloyl-ACP methyl ester carboxylesterase
MIEEDRTLLDPLSFTRFFVRDAFGRRITCYLSKYRSSDPRPLALFIQGSGCHSVFRYGEGGAIRGSQQNLLLQAAEDRVRVLVVEKPGVEYLDNPGLRGTAENCRAIFHEEHTLPRWVTALSAAVTGICTLPSIRRNPLLVFGHSEGGIVAARLAAERPEITHIAILSGNGPTQLFDLAVQARGDDPSESFAAREARVEEVYQEFANIQDDPDSTTKFAWGHPYRRWSSFLATSTLDELLRSSASVYLAYGANDPVIPRASFEMLRAELIRNGRIPRAQVVENADHGLRIEGHGATDTMTGIMTDVLRWFLEDAS